MDASVFDARHIKSVRDASIDPGQACERGLPIACGAKTHNCAAGNRLIGFHTGENTKMNSIVIRMLGAASFAATALLAPTSASAMFVCWVKKTPDGFVALRAQPNAEAKLVARMRANDVLHADPDVKERNGWQYVTWWKKKTHAVHSANFDKKDGRGWVNTRLITSGDDCG